MNHDKSRLIFEFNLSRMTDSFHSWPTRLIVWILLQHLPSYNYVGHCGLPEWWYFYCGILTIPNITQILLSKPRGYFLRRPEQVISIFECHLSFHMSFSQLDCQKMSTHSLIIVFATSSMYAKESCKPPRRGHQRALVLFRCVMSLYLLPVLLGSQKTTY